MFFKVLGVLLVALLVGGTIFYFYSDINVGTSYRLFHVKATNFLDFLLPVLLSGFFVSLLVGGFVALFFPHNFAGPLFRIESELIDIGRGNFSKKLKLRKGSEVNDLADAELEIALSDARERKLSAHEAHNLQILDFVRRRKHQYNEAL